MCIVPKEKYRYRVKVRARVFRCGHSVVDTVRASEQAARGIVRLEMRPEAVFEERGGECRRASVSYVSDVPFITVILDAIQLAGNLDSGDL